MKIIIQLENVSEIKKAFAETYPQMPLRSGTRD